MDDLDAVKIWRQVETIVGRHVHVGNRLNDPCGKKSETINSAKHTPSFQPYEAGSVNKRHPDAMARGKGELIPNLFTDLRDGAPEAHIYNF